MNRKFTILALCGLSAVALFLISARKKPAPANQSVVVTPDGKLTALPQRDAWSVTLNQPQTNRSGAKPNPTDK